MKCAAAFVTLVIVLAAFACDDHESPSATAPTATGVLLQTAVSPPRVPTPTIPPFPQIGPPIETSGWIVFHRAWDLWVARLDGSREHRLTSRTDGSSFAGVVTRSDGSRELYYTLALPPVNTGMVRSVRIELARQPLDDSRPSEVIFSFDVSGHWLQTPFDGTYASVSPDGSFVAYADETGLWLRDLTSGLSKRLLTNNNDDACDDVSIGLCSSYAEPAWSPTGDWLVLTRVLYEGAIADFIRPHEPVTEYTSDVGAHWRAWSYDGTQICGPEGRLQISGWAVTTPTGDHQRDIGEELRRAGVQVGGWITDCAWADDGRIALQYMHDDRGYDQRIAVLAPDGSLLADIDHPLFQSGLQGWLPDQSGFILAYGDGEGHPLSFIVLLDGSVHALAVETDDVVAVFPD